MASKPDDAQKQLKKFDAQAARAAKDLALTKKADKSRKAVLASFKKLKAGMKGAKG